MSTNPLLRLRWAAAVVADPMVTNAGKRLAPLMAWMARTGTCRPSIATLMEETDQWRSQVQDGLKSMRKQGWITYTSNRGRSNTTVYVLNTEKAQGYEPFNNEIAQPDGPIDDGKGPKFDTKRPKKRPEKAHPGGPESRENIGGTESQEEKSLSDPPDKTPEPTPEDRWKLERLEPWARKLQPILGGKLNGRTWQSYKRLVDDFTLEAVYSAAKSASPDDRWDDKLETDLAATATRRPAVIETPIDPIIEAALQIVGVRGWLACSEAIGPEARDHEDYVAKLQGNLGACREIIEHQWANAQEAAP